MYEVGLIINSVIFCLKSIFYQHINVLFLNIVSFQL